MKKKGLLALVMAGIMAVMLTACGTVPENTASSGSDTAATEEAAPSGNEEAEAPADVSAEAPAGATASGLPSLTKDDIKVGAVFNTEFGTEGFSYALYLGFQALENAGYQVKYATSVPESAECETAIESLIADGCNVIYTTSYGFGEYTANVADKYPDVYFNHYSGSINKTNMATFFPKNFQSEYLCGIIAGAKTETNQIGYLCSYPIPEPIRMVNAFTLGAQSVKGHLDESVRTAMKMGFDFVTAIQMVTINAARAFQLEYAIGGLAPGKRADINITTGPEDFKVSSVVAGGRLVVEDGKSVVTYPRLQHKPVLLDTVHLTDAASPFDFDIRVDEKAISADVKVMDTLPWIPITQGRDVTLPVKDGVIQNDVEQDVLYIAQVERHGKNGNIGNALMGGFHMQKGAMAYSMGHDNHNIVVLGADKRDMALAVNRVEELQGGQVLVVDGEIKAEIALPIAGLLTDLTAEELAEKKRAFVEAIREVGCPISFPDMFLSFICLAAIPCYAVTDHGFIDVLQQAVIDPVLKVNM
ncbi:MAG: adenine deaminase C-terminal domain-containing protein [Lachnospiraceae bacterium]|nr:adenine deaminase C-terminal domain-containing protein [Lachnospiraceae bacterium]